MANYIQELVDRLEVIHKTCEDKEAIRDTIGILTTQFLIEKPKPTMENLDKIEGFGVHYWRYYGN